jgi:hypothetical protein
VGRHGRDTGRDAQELGSQLLEICYLCFCVQDLHIKLRIEGASCGESHAWYDPQTLDWRSGALDAECILLLIHQDNGPNRFPATALEAEVGKICNKIPEHAFIISLNTLDTRTIKVLIIDSSEVALPWKFVQSSLNTPPALGLGILPRVGVNHSSLAIL